MTHISKTDSVSPISRETQVFNATALAHHLVGTALVHSTHGFHRTSRQYLSEALHVLARALHAQEHERHRPADLPRKIAGPSS